jgi:hypothetical protein
MRGYPQKIRDGGISRTHTSMRSREQLLLKEPAISCADKRSDGAAAQPKSVSGRPRPRHRIRRHEKFR